MPVNILNHHFNSANAVEIRLIIDTLERNRDRTRVTANMIVTLSGILISLSSALLLYLVHEKAMAPSVLLSFIFAIFGLFIASLLGIASTFLRTDYAVSDEPQFLTDLLRLYNSELRLLRSATVALTFGLLLLVAGTCIFFVTVAG
jgi:hypothetical protein